MVWIELTVSSQAVEKSLDIWSEDGVKSCIVYLVQMFSKTVPEIKGDLHHLEQNIYICLNSLNHRDQNHN